MVLRFSCDQLHSVVIRFQTIQKSPDLQDKSDENIEAGNKCSPSKNRKKEARGRPRRTETPVRGSLRTKLYPDENAGSPVPSPLKVKQCKNSSTAPPMSSPLKVKDCVPVSSPLKAKDCNPPVAYTHQELAVKNACASPRPKIKGENKENTPTKNTPRRKLLENTCTSPVRYPLSPIKVKPLDYNYVSPTKKSPVLKLQRQDGQAYHKAKQSFHTAKPERLVGREKETEEINKFVRGHVSAKTAGSLYISGAPGTGKTATLSHIIDDVKASHSCKCLYLNCMTLKDSATVYGKLYTDLTGKSPPSAKDRQRAVEKVLTANGPSIIMVLDEIDQLDSKNNEILYTIFEWPSLNKSRLVLIGIANALDLTDRVLPRLQARPNCKPKLLNFAPYSKDQIAAILKDRLVQLEKDGMCVMEPSAVQFCARKISAVAGDMRKALDVCRRSVEMVEHEVKGQRVLAATGCTSPSKSSPVPKKIGVIQISKVLSEVYGSSSSTQQQESVPLQQKLIVCTLLLMVKLGKMKEVTMGKLHDTYTKVCKKRQISPVDYSEYQGVCTLLETRGIMGIKKIKDGRMAKISLKLDEQELEHTLQDKVLISSLLQDGLPK
ncbi:hypothetical protein FSP39_024975 [Pinctada imbricata]|uniref:Cell division control protein n=1 Tax=Pinctada imbricata TaxID=66713 RepID=A0AA89BIF7_PINIB|nr:hypothetical protein FSP39_024975 [Pinctada imbricata]